MSGGLLFIELLESRGTNTEKSRVGSSDLQIFDYERTFKMEKIVNTAIYPNESKKTVVVVITDEYNKKFKGQSWCVEGDTWDIDTGVKIAALKAQLKMVNYYKKQYEKTLEYNTKSYENFKERCIKAIDERIKVLDYIKKDMNSLYDSLD